MKLKDASKIGKFIEVLKKTKQLISSSADPIYSNATVSEIVSSLDKNISSLNESGEFDLNQIVLLFGPTGAIQETSMDNGWSDKFIELSGEVDVFTEME